jgi:hypothetical protein
MYNPDSYESLRRANPKFLVFKISARDEEVREWIENLQGRRGHIKLAQEIVARYRGVSDWTTEKDWKTNKNKFASRRKR